MLRCARYVECAAQRHFDEAMRGAARCAADGAADIAHADIADDAALRAASAFRFHAAAATPQTYGCC